MVPHTYKIGLLLLEDFNAMAMHAFVDPFRAANYLKGSTQYEWQFLSLEVPRVKASNGLCVCDLKPIGETGRFDLVVVNASWHPERFQDLALLSWLRDLAHKGVTLAGLDTGAFLLSYAGLMRGRRAAVHYDHIAAFRELFPDVEVGEDLFVMDDDRLTCCGGSAATDMALEIIGLQQGIETANAASRYIFHERLRNGAEGQLSEKQEPIGVSAPKKVRDAILLMERNLEETLPIAKLAQSVSLSQRQLDRLFKAHTGLSPIAYYVNIRLDRARGLITQTELPVLDVAIACGFSSNAQFTRAYKQRFKITPSADRIEGRVPFQFRSFPSHTSI